MQGEARPINPPELSLNGVLGRRVYQSRHASTAGLQDPDLYGRWCRANERGDELFYVSLSGDVTAVSVSTQGRSRK